jgi:hypothetical protein
MKNQRENKQVPAQKPLKTGTGGNLPRQLDVSNCRGKLSRQVDEAI